MTVDPNNPDVVDGGASPPSDPPTEKNGSRTPTPEDYAALARTHEEKRKAAEAALAEERARREELERRSMQPLYPQQTNDPFANALNAHKTAAALGDEQSMFTLEVAKTAAQTALENQRMKAMIKGGVSAAEWDAVEQQLVQNPRLTVDQARKVARGPAAEEAEQLRQQLAETKRLLEQEKNRVRVPNMAITPAAPARDATKIPRAQANEILARGGEEARQLKARLNSPPGSEGHLEYDNSK